MEFSFFCIFVNRKIHYDSEILEKSSTFVNVN